MKPQPTTSLLLLGFVLAALLVALPAAADTGSVAEYAVPTAGSQPVSLVGGPDGNLWFTEYAGNKIGRLSTDGTFNEFAIPSAASQPDELAVGPDGNVWFAETAGNKLGRVTPTGDITEFAEGISPASQPTAIVTGPDGNLWFTERALTSPTGRIGRITPTGGVAEYGTGITGHPLVITAGADGNLWFTESPGNKIGRIDPASGLVHETTVPTFQSAPWEIAAGPDGNLWFTELLGNKIGRITSDGEITEFPVPSPASRPNTIRPGPDPDPAKNCAFQRERLGEDGFAARYGSFGGCVARLATTKTLWFSEQFGNKIGQITTNGDIFEFPLPSANSQPNGVAEGLDGAVWFAEQVGNKIGRLDVDSLGAG
jgi:streptogramin lyase